MEPTVLSGQSREQGKQDMAQSRGGWSCWEWEWLSDLLHML